MYAAAVGVIIVTLMSTGRPSELTRYRGANERTLALLSIKAHEERGGCSKEKAPESASTLSARLRLAKRAANDTDPQSAAFHKAMESKWMDMAAAAAFFERVDLFLQTREFRSRLSPADMCAFCNKRMSLKTIQETAAETVYVFRCSDCGAERTRRIP